MFLELSAATAILSFLVELNPRPKPYLLRRGMAILVAEGPKGLY